MSASILVADDEPGFRDLFSFALQPLGYRVTGVGDGAEAVAQAAMRPFDLVVLDHHMPRLSGLEALKQLKALMPQLKVMVVSGSADDRQLLEAEVLAAGAACCLFKPLELASLIQAVELQLRKE
ncbi:MAG: response regulator [Archangiaceae bacterium]|nr:response regulator [Archangiaceae bacterium]